MNWTACTECQGLGKKKLRLRKKVRLQYQKELEEFEKNNKQGNAPIKPTTNLVPCVNCSGTGLVKGSTYPIVENDHYPHVAIIGGGIGGAALAVACMHRGIPFTLYERDDNFEARAQGYGLTLQQASKAIQGLGIFSLDKGIISTRHVVHTTDGKTLGEWGMRKWLESNEKKTNKRTNIHIARQALRLELLKQLEGNKNVKWGHKLVDFSTDEKNELQLTFDVNGNITTEKSDLLIGADGIRSTVRSKLIGEDYTPLRYLGCIVILGICSLEALKNIDSPLLDSETVFQTANGNERIYVMPYDADSVMWQLSFPMSEEEAKELSSKGLKALKEEACIRTQWHSPIPEIVSSTLETQISGYPVYDRTLLTSESFEKAGPITLIGDAAHPMSPFKGQGANQALLDALSLARKIVKGCHPNSNWKENSIRNTVLADYETEMLERSAVKVQDSATAVEFLHSEMILQEGDEPRGRSLKRGKIS